MTTPILTEYGIGQLPVRAVHNELKDPTVDVLDLLTAVNAKKVWRVEQRTAKYAMNGVTGRRVTRPLRRLENIHAVRLTTETSGGYQLYSLTDAGMVALARHRPQLGLITFARQVRCGGCGELLPDQDGVPADCLCIRLESIECLCPDANLEYGQYVDYCPRHGTDGETAASAAEQCGPWYANQMPEANSRA